MTHHIGEVWSCTDGSDCLRAEKRREKREEGLRGKSSRGAR